MSSLYENMCWPWCRACTKTRNTGTQENPRTPEHRKSQKTPEHRIKNDGVVLFFLLQTVTILRDTPCVRNLGALFGHEMKQAIFT